MGPYVEVHRAKLGYIRPMLSHIRLMLRYISGLGPHVEVHRTLGTYRTSRKLSWPRVQRLSKHQYIRLVLLDLLSVADLLPTVELDLQAERSWSACCVKFWGPVSRVGLSGQLSGRQEACQERCQAVRRPVRRPVRQSGGLSGGPPGLSGGLSGELPGSEEARQEGCQEVRRPAWRAARLSVELPGGQEASQTAEQARSSRHSASSEAPAVRNPAQISRELRRIRGQNCLAAKPWD